MWRLSTRCGAPARAAAPSGVRPLGHPHPPAVALRLFLGCQQRRAQGGGGGGAQVLVAGKHVGLSFDEVLAKDPQYCDWLVAKAQERSMPAYEDFVAFVAARRSEADAGDGTAHASPATPPSPRSWQRPTFAAGVPARGATWRGAGAPRDASGRVPKVDGGSEVLKFGRMRGKTFAEAVSEEPKYCRWFLASAERDPDATPDQSENWTAFVAYLRAALAASPAPQSSATSAASAWDAEVEEGADLASGEWEVTFGKHKGSTFFELYAKDRQYCLWMLNQAMHQSKQPNKTVAPFLIYVQHRLLQEGSSRSVASGDRGSGLE